MEAHRLSLRRRRSLSTEDSAPEEIQTTYTETEPRPLRPLATFSRQVSSQSVPVDPGISGADYDISRRDDEFYEQHEQRPTATTDLHIQNTPITHITASPMPRRSRLSRLNSWILDRRVPDGANNEPVQFGQSVSIQAGSDEYSRRNSLRSSVLPTFDLPNLSPRPRQRREITSISSPVFPRSIVRHISRRSNLPGPGLPDPDTRASGLFSNPFAARLSRLAHSINSQLDMSNLAARRPVDGDAHRPLPEPLSLASGDDSGFHLPPMNLLDTNTGLSEAVLGGANREPRLFQIPTLPEAFESAELPADEQHRQETLRSDTPEIRANERIAVISRGDIGGSVQIRSDEMPWLHMLNATASAIAAQILESPEQSGFGVQGLEFEEADGRLQHLSRTLQHAVHANFSRDMNEAAGDESALNSLQIFRFIPQSATQRSLIESLSGGDAAEDTANSLSTMARNSSDDRLERSVTIILVGVRSSTSDQQAFDSEEHQTLAEAPEASSALGLSLPGQLTNLVPSRTVRVPRHAGRYSRHHHLRRASYGAAFRTHDVFAANQDAQQHYRLIPSHSNVGDTSPNPETNAPFAFSESPPGPAPPPSTPAEHTLSAVSSQATTPSRRVSAVSSLQHSPLFDRETPIPGSLQENGLVPEDRPFQSVQQRRRSDSESARHRNLGLGAARRNGVVEPDGLDAGESSVGGSRTWIFYIIGTHLPDDHPAWTTPSLFTDVSVHIILNISTANLYDTESLL